jgi:arabinan endo-1,5-alpha-L-arabinosidase
LKPSFKKILILMVGFAGASALDAEVLVGAHDPTVLRDSRGVYSLLCTNNLLQIRQSTDEINWKVVGNIVPAVPAWVTTALGPSVTDIWAPDARYRNGSYWVYYACSSFGTNNSVIGLATNPTLDPTAANYKWTDQGLVFQSSTANNYNAIDPASYIDLNGNVWMVFGSFWDGIKMIAIDPTTGKQLAGNTKIYSLASRGGGAIEGATLIEHGTDYYLFSSWDVCCQGVSSTYNVRVGRSASVTGPYVDEAGVNLMNSGGTEILSAYGIYIGPGGGSALHDGRRDFYSHHYYNANQNGNAYLHNREIVWDAQGWPHLTQPYMGHHNALEAEHAQLTGVNFAQGATASNGEYINGLNTAAGRVVFHFNALAAETYELRILYANGGGSPSTHLLTVNGNPPLTVTYPATAAFGTFSQSQTVTENVPLTEGYNMISFQQGTGQAELDRVDVLRPAGNAVPAGSADNGVSYTYQAAGNAATLSATGWTEYEYLDFKTGGFNSLSVVFTGSATGPLRFVLDSLTGSVAVTTTLSVSGPQTITVPLPAPFINTTGVHDVFVQYNGTGTSPLSQFQFVQSGATPTMTATQTFTLTPSATRTMTASATPTPSATATKTLTATQTATLTPTVTVTLTPTKALTSVPTMTSSPTLTKTPTASPMATATVTSTLTSTSTRTPSFTMTPVATASATTTKTFTETPTPSATITFSNTLTTTLTASPTVSATATLTPVFSTTPTPTGTPSASQTPTPSSTQTSTASVTATATKTASLTPTPTFTLTKTPIFTRTPSATFTPTPSVTATLSATQSATAVILVTATPTVGQGVPITTPIPFPNPATGPTVTISFNLRSSSPWVRVEIFTTAFRKVNEIDFSNVPAGARLNTLPLTDSHGSALANGVYYVVVVNQQGRAIGKLLILH